MEFDYAVRKWISDYPEFFENSDYVKNMLLRLKTIQHNMNDVKDYYFNNYLTDENPYCSLFYSDIINVNKYINRWVEEFHQLYNKIEHSYNIEEIDMIETFDDKFVYIGLLDDNYWFLHTENYIYIYDSKPLEEQVENQMDLNWHEVHLISVLEPNTKTKELYEQMYSFLNEKNLSENSKEIYKKHFDNLIKEINDKSNEDYIV